MGEDKEEGDIKDYQNIRISDVNFLITCSSDTLMSCPFPSPFPLFNKVEK